MPIPAIEVSPDASAEVPAPPAGRHRSLVAGALRIGGIYLVVSAAWIILSDRALGAFVSDPALVARIQTGKGIAFVALSAMLVAALAWRELRVQERADRERLERERRHRRSTSVIEQMEEAVLVLDRQGRIEYGNPAFERITGYGEDESLGRSLDFYHDEDTDEVRRDIRDAIREGRSWSGRVRIRRRDGEVRQFSCTLSPVRGPAGGLENFVCLGRDVTKVLELEQHLRQAQKMEAIGTLTGGIAHDFNNLLTVILANAELGLLQLAEDAPLRKELEQVQESAKRGGDLVRKLLIFARNETPVREPVDLDHGVEQVVEALRRLLPESIRIEVDSDGLPHTVHADGSAIQQILLNLSTNARDAMPEGGRLRIRMRRARLTDADRLQHPWVEPGAYVELSVEDTGTGMNEIVLEQIFDPFYSTKAPGHGSGLGLATVYGLVKEMGGFVHVFSEVGVGSTFQVYLPLHGPGEEGKLPGEEDGAVAGGRPLAPREEGPETTVLVVDDDDQLRAATLRMLGRLGFRTLAARNGVEAWAMLQDGARGVHVVISDQDMPELDGRGLLRRMRGEGMTTPFVLATGYGRKSQGVDDTGGGDMHVIEKPWTALDLERAVRAALGES